MPLDPPLRATKVSFFSYSPRNFLWKTNLFRRLERDFVEVVVWPGYLGRDPASVFVDVERRQSRPECDETRLGRFRFGICFRVEIGIDLDRLGELRFEVLRRRPRVHEFELWDVSEEQLVWVRNSEWSFAPLLSG